MYRKSCVLLLLVALTLIAARPAWRHHAARQLEQQLHGAMQRGDYAGAAALAERLLTYEPRSDTALRAAAEAHHNLGDTRRAERYYQQLMHAGKTTAYDHLAVGELALKGMRPDDAERHFRVALDIDPQLHAARASLIFLLSLQSRTAEANVQRRELLRQGVWTFEDLLALAKPEDLTHYPELDALLSKNPHHAWLLLAKARHARLVNREHESEQYLRRAMSAAPQMAAAHAELGLLLWEQQADDGQLLKWHQHAPDAAQQLAAVWLVRGHWARRQKNLAAAARCFGEALLRDPQHRAAAHQFALALSALGKDEAAAHWIDRVALLDELHRTVDEIHDRPAHVDHWRRAGETLEQLGRWQEAIAWYRMAAARYPELAQLAERLANRQGDDGPAVPDLASFPLPSFHERTPHRAVDQNHSATALQFRQVAPEVGLDFGLLDWRLPVRRGRSMPALFGSGVAVLDLDQDGWPDVYCGQAAEHFGGASDSARDQVFHNRQGRFVNITRLTALDDFLFTQGIAVGDFDADGFPDLLVAHVGPNRLYRNNGDGTFRDVTESSGLQGRDWTSSCAVADLDGDGLPELIEVNYLGGEALDVVCGGASDDGGQCTPRSFPAVADRCWRNEGQGHFREITEAAGLTGSDGKGLGLIVGDFTGDGLLGIFVANDTTANHYYVNQAPRGAMPRFAERALFAGLAYDRHGLSQACMGIAADDSDGDQRLDLLVTNFFDEPNTLYRGLAGGYFEDATPAAALHAPTLGSLGFGTQFLDADLDGDPDLFVANGHIDSSGSGGAAFQMRPQLFANTGGGRYAELTGGAAGEYFLQERLGRAAARLDFNRDGREDLLVGHLDAPVALLRNSTETGHHYLALRLVGRRSERDAIGAVVTISAGGRQTLRQVLAGDGYQCSNQRHLLFGLGQATQADVTIAWPSGYRQRLPALQADRQWVVAEMLPPRALP